MTDQKIIHSANGNAGIVRQLPAFLKLDSHLALWLMLFLALLVRLAALVSFSKSRYADFLIWDEKVYQDWSHHLLTGTRWPYELPDFSPVPAYLMAFLYRLLSEETLTVRLFNMLLGVITCYLIYRIGQSLAGRRAGLVAGFLAAVYEPFIFFNITILKTSLSLMLFALTVMLLLCYLERASMYGLLLLGAVAGLCASVRANSVVIIPVTLLVLLLAGRRSALKLENQAAAALLFVIGLISVLAPLSVWSYRNSGEVVPLPSAGFNLYLGNNLENPIPYYRPTPFSSSSPFYQSVQFTVEASRREGRTLSAREASSYWAKEVLRTSRREPVAMLRKASLKMLAVFNGFEGAENYHIGFTSRFVHFFKLPFLPVWLVFPMGLAGMVVSLRDSLERKAMAILFVAYAATLVVFFTNVRLRLPVLIILIPFAVIGMQKLWGWARCARWSQCAGFVVLSGVFFVIAFLPIPGRGELAAFYNTHAILLERQGLQQEAISFWKDSSDLNESYSVFADLALAEAEARKDNFPEALRYLQKIPDDSFASSLKYSGLGEIYAIQGDRERAERAYRRSLEINSSERKPREKLIRLLLTHDREQARAQNEEMRHILSFYRGHGQTP